jgi:hypothetical protein
MFISNNLVMKLLHSSILLILLEISLHPRSSISGTILVQLCLLIWNIALTMASDTVANMIYIALVMAYRFSDNKIHVH